MIGTDEPGSAPASIAGSTSDGEVFTLITPGGWITHDAAVNYALEYARGVSVADRTIEIDRFPTATIITVRGIGKHAPVRGQEYAERLTIPMPVSAPEFPFPGYELSAPPPEPDARR